MKKITYILFMSQLSRQAEVFCAMNDNKCEFLPSVPYNIIPIGNSILLLPLVEGGKRGKMGYIYILVMFLCISLVHFCQG